MSDLTKFQYDALAAISMLERRGDKTHGLGVKDELETSDGFDYGEVNHGRLYPNLDTLVDEDLITKTDIDRRTNSYSLNATGEFVLESRADMFSQVTEEAEA